MPIRTVTSGGRVTIPKEVRAYLELKPGDGVVFIRDRTGRFQLRTSEPNARPQKRIRSRPK